MTLKTFFTSTIFAIFVYLGFVMDIVFFRILFDIGFGLLIFGTLILLIFYFGFDVIKKDIKSYATVFKDYNYWQIISSIPFIIFNFYCLNFMFPVFAAWYLIIVFIIHITTILLKRKIEHSL